MMILLSDAMFERVLTRAQEVGAEQWRRLLFDCPGMLERMSPDAQAWIRDQLIDAFAEHYVDHLADAAAERLQRRKGDADGPH
jgi:hypothetical protein